MPAATDAARAAVLARSVPPRPGPGRHTAVVDLPIDLPVAPMLAKAVPSVPDADSVAGGPSYEPKWDGFRAHRLLGRREVEIGSRGAKPLTRYFPELVEAFARLLPAPCVLDGEIVVRSGEPGAAAARLGGAVAAHPPGGLAACNMLAERPRRCSSPSTCSRSATTTCRARRSPSGGARWSNCWPGCRAPIHLTRTTTDVDLARRWLASSRAPASTASSPSRSRRRTRRTSARCSRSSTPAPRTSCVLGYRIHKRAAGSARCCSGCTTDDGELRNVGGVSAFSDAPRLELIDELAPLVLARRGRRSVTGETDRSRFSAAARTSRSCACGPSACSRCATTRWRGRGSGTPRSSCAGARTGTPRSCTFEQLDRPIAYDLSQVLTH